MNKVMLIGNVGQDPVVRYLDNGVCVASVRLATTERGYTLQNGTQVPDRTEWHSLIFWRKQAETVEKFVHKGDKLYVEGKIQSRKYDDRQGVTHQVVEIMVDQMEMLTPRSSTPSTANDTPQQTPTQQVVTPSQNDDEPPF